MRGYNLRCRVVVVTNDLKIERKYESTQRALLHENLVYQRS